MYSYNIKRFEAARTIRRAGEYVCSIAECQLDKEAEEYMKHGLYILHCIYSFDACIQAKKAEAGKIYKEYIDKFEDVERDIKKTLPDMKCSPRGISKKRLMLFKLSRKWYLILYGFKSVKVH